LNKGLSVRRALFILTNKKLHKYKGENTKKSTSIDLRTIIGNNTIIKDA
jgi:hypothetical protein